MKSWLETNAIEMNEILLLLKVIRILKNKIYKYQTSISKNVYIDKLDDIVNKYNNTQSHN